jgi:hypothetical protein
LARLETPQFILQLRKQKEVKATKSAELPRPEPSQLNLVPQAEEMKLTGGRDQSQSQSQSQLPPQSQAMQPPPQQRQSLATSQRQQQQLPRVDTDSGATAAGNTNTSTNTSAGPTFPSTIYSPDDFSVMDDLAMDMDWQRWDTLLNDFEMPVPVQPSPEGMHPAQLQFLGQYGQQGYS